MTDSKRQVPHFYLSTDIEMDVLVEAAGRIIEDPGTWTEASA